MPLKHSHAEAPRSLSDVVSLEIDMRWSRESGTMDALASPISLGAVLAMDDAGHYMPYLSDTSADAAVAVLLSVSLPASSTDQACSVLRRGACVSASGLEWLPDVTQEQKLIALHQLSALGIVSKE